MGCECDEQQKTEGPLVVFALGVYLDDGEEDVVSLSDLEKNVADEVVDTVGSVEDALPTK